MVNWMLILQYHDSDNKNIWKAFKLIFFWKIVDNDKVILKDHGKLCFT